MQLRFAEEFDLDAVTALINRAFAVERFFKTNERLTLADTHAYFAKGRYLLAEEDGSLIGCAYVELQGDCCYLGQLSVDPSRQRNGVGHRLSIAAEEFAREMGVHRMVLNVVDLRTELPPIYEKLGYFVTGTEPIPEEMARHVSQPCRFVRMSKRLGGN